MTKIISKEHETRLDKIVELTDTDLDHVAGGRPPNEDTPRPVDTPSGKNENAPKGTPPSRPHFFF